MFSHLPLQHRQEQARRFKETSGSRLSPILHSPHCEVATPKPLIPKPNHSHHSQSNQKAGPFTSSPKHAKFIPPQPLVKIQNFGSCDNVRIHHSPGDVMVGEEKGVTEAKLTTEKIFSQPTSGRESEKTAVQPVSGRASEKTPGQPVTGRASDKTQSHHTAIMDSTGSGPDTGRVSDILGRSYNDKKSLQELMEQTGECSL